MSTAGCRRPARAPPEPGAWRASTRRIHAQPCCPDGLTLPHRLDPDARAPARRVDPGGHLVRDPVGNGVRGTLIAWAQREASLGTSCAISLGSKVAGYTVVSLPLALIP